MHCFYSITIVFLWRRTWKCELNWHRHFSTCNILTKHSKFLGKLSLIRTKFIGCLFQMVRLYTKWVIVTNVTLGEQKPCQSLEFYKSNYIPPMESYSCLKRTCLVERWTTNLRIHLQKKYYFLVNPGVLKSFVDVQ